MVDEMGKRIKILCRAPKLLAIVLGLGAVLLGYIWISCYLGIRHVEYEAREQATQTTANLASVFKEHAERSLENADRLTSFLQKNYSREGVDTGLLLDLLQQDFLYHIYIFDAEGNCAAGQDASAENLRTTAVIRSYLSLYQTMAADTMFIGQDVWDAQRRVWTVPLMRRLIRADGSYGGMVVMLTNSYYFSDLYNQLDLDGESMIFLAGRDRSVRAAKHRSLLEPGSMLHADGLAPQEMQRSELQTTILNSQTNGGRRYIYSYRSLTHYPLLVAVGVPEDKVLAQAGPEIRQHVLVSGGLSLGVVLVLLLLLCLMYRQRLMEAEVQAARDGLQQTVAARTAELLETNGQLSQMNASLEDANRQLEEEVAERRTTEEKLRQADASMRRIAYYSGATGLPNRVCFHQWLTRKLEHGFGEDAGAALLAINLDNLQTVNDVFGHRYGDAVIVEAAHRIEETVSENAFVAHCGADEFAVVLPGVVDAEDISQQVQELLGAIRHVHRFNNITIHVTASIGVAVYPAHGTTAEELLKNVDNALGAAKQAGKNQWCSFSEDMQAELYEDVMLTAQLHRAIKQQEFVLYYQPQVAAVTGRVTGFEALVRWISPERGFVSPGSFIPLAERTGLIHEIGQWVMAEACRFAVQLAKMGHSELTIAVNVSGQQFSRDDFLESFRQTMQETAANPRQIELEITETAMMKSLEGTVSKLKFLRDMGVRVSLDDFGTGYSSMNYLLRMPFDTLKIDKSFIDQVGGNVKGGQIVAVILMMAHILGKQVVAEGVETVEQLDYLRKSGCDMIQGFFFSRPLPKEQAVAFLEQNLQAGEAKPDA